MKRFLPIFFVIVVVCLAVSFAVQSGTEAQATSPAEAAPLVKMELIGKSEVDMDFEEFFFYYRDVATDVMYVRASRKVMNAGLGGLTVMLDPETGLPLTYTRYMEIVNGSASSIPTCSNCGAECKADYCGDCGTVMKEG